MILRSMTTNNTVSIVNAFANGGSKSLNTTDWVVVQYPEMNPKEPLGFNVGMWKCLMLLAIISVVLRFLALFFIKVLIKKFQ